MTNVTSGYTNSFSPSLKLTVSVLMLLCLFMFLYFIIVLLSIYFTSTHVRENTRYILFAHMLINDALYTIIGLFLLITALYILYLPVPLCYLLVTVSSSSFKVTPYNLAVMALERYVAICFPLRHAEFCTHRNALIAIALIWAIGLIPNIVDFIVLCSSVHVDFFYLDVMCARATFTITTMQNNIRFFTHTMTFSLVGLIIVFTYIKIMLVAMNIDTNKASASKAGKTVMLHAVQLLLCMTAFSYTLTELYFRAYFYILPIMNFAVFMCLPRFLSPLIYGIRDDVFKRYLKQYLLCNPSRIDPNIRLE
ncbi:odorant receptor 131-2-like [Discoglossus pictus]